jgi:hypothetical protein
MTHQNLVLTEKAIKNHCKRLKKELSVLNPNISLGESQQIFSKALGFNNWNHLSKIINNGVEVNKEIREFLDIFNSFLKNNEESEEQEINQIKSLLEKEQNGLNHSIENFSLIKLTAGLSLIDYIIRNNEKIPHEFKYDKKEDYYIGEFVGYFSNELIEIQTILGENPISFYINIRDTNKPPYLNFEKSFDFNVKTIREHFIADFEPLEFDKIVKDYLQYKKTIINSNKKKIKP